MLLDSVVLSAVPTCALSGLTRLEGTRRRIGQSPHAAPSALFLARAIMDALFLLLIVWTCASGDLVVSGTFDGDS